MKIEKIKINAYGKLKEKEIDFRDNINLVYGKNESGKSTLLKFILNIFYGTSKNKKGKDISDFEKYKPWKAEDFSGKLSYRLDDGTYYEVYREFGKKNPKIFDEKMNDISAYFNIDKTRGNEFFYEQTKIDENLFCLTTAIEQKEVQLDISSQNILIQKIANILGTGEDNVSYKKAVDKISKRQLNEIGTDKSKERPINILTKEINDGLSEVKDLENASLNRASVEEKINLNKININNLENELKVVKKVKELYNNEMDSKNEIRIKEEINNKNKEDLIDIEEKIKKINESTNKENEKYKSKIKRLNKINFMNILLLVISMLLIIKFKIIGIFFSIIFALIIFGVSSKKIKVQNILNNNISSDLIELQQKRTILIESIENSEDEISNIKEQYAKSNIIQKDIILKEFKEKLPELTIKEIINTLSLDYKEEIMQEELNKLKVEVHTLNIEKNNIEEKIEKKLTLKENIYIKQKELKELIKLSNSMDYAKNVLKVAYEKMKSNVAPKFTEKLSQFISEITNNKYDRILINSEEGLIVENDSGDYVSVERLSVGTIDQIYFALRLAVMDELTNENLPIILDEVFAYYDDERIENILKFLSKYTSRQIIILTCTQRELNIFEKLNISINYIEI